MTLFEYVKRRNGVALGVQGSMLNMLKRSIGASSFPIFWHYWNPIWGYYLGKNIMKPLKKVLPITFVIIITFAISGFIHDLAITLVKRELTIIFTPWFILMGLIVSISQKHHISYKNQHWLTKALINMTTITICWFVSQWLFAGFIP